MKLRFVVFLLVILLLSISGLNFYHLMQVKKNRQLFVEQSSYLSDEVKYLERCLKYRLHIDQNNIPQIPDKDILVYFSGRVCPSCAEKLLHYIWNNSKIRERVLVLVNDNSKLDFIVGFNDAFQLNYDYLFDSTKILDPVNEILVLRTAEGDIKCVLEYRPEENITFEKYFSSFF